MHYRNSLRFRIFAIFVGAGLLLGPLLALAFLTVSNELEELAIARVLAGQLHQAMATPDETNFATHPDTPNLRVFGDISVADIPPELEGRTGIYEIDAGESPAYEGPLPSPSLDSSVSLGKSWLLAVGSEGETTFVVAVDQSALELRESLTTWVVAVGTVLSVSMSLWFGYHFTKRLIRPIQQLAAATSAGGGVGSVQINPEDYPPDEIGQLASALMRDRDGMTEALIREKAFSAEVAHELRNPLAVIQSTMEIVEKDAELPTLSGRALGRALIAVHEMSETLDALLLLGREQTRPASYPAVNVAAVLRPVMERISKHTAIRIELKQISAPAISAPEVAIRMVVDNLVRNAVQNTPSGSVEVSLQANHLVVRDTGIGIPAAEIDEVRRIGVRGSNALGSGSGLGLALVDRLCKSFGWSVDIQSNKGKGTIATWRFG